MANKIYRARCDCGWTGPTRELPEQAANDYRAHTVTVVRPEFHHYRRFTGRLGTREVK